VHHRILCFGLNKHLHIKTGRVCGDLSINYMAIYHRHLEHVIKNSFIPYPRSIWEEVRFTTSTHQIHATHMLDTIGHSRWSQNLTYASGSLLASNVHRGARGLVHSHVVLSTVVKSVNRLVSRHAMASLRSLRRQAGGSPFSRPRFDGRRSCGTPLLLALHVPHNPRALPRNRSATSGGEVWWQKTRGHQILDNLLGR